MLTIKQKTYLKLRPIQSDDLDDSEKKMIQPGETYPLDVLPVEVRSHYRIPISLFPGCDYFYVYKGHCTLANDPLGNIKLKVKYRSQLDNLYNPTGSCNVTSMAMAIDFFLPERVKAEEKSGKQFEDILYQHCINKGWSRHDPYDLATLSLAWGVRDCFTENSSIEEVKEWLLEKRSPVVIHGYFTAFGHIVTVVGCDPLGLIVHDPYGEYFPYGYCTDLSGAYLHYSNALIRRTCCPDGKFWVHYLSVD